MRVVLKIFVDCFVFGRRWGEDYVCSGLFLECDGFIVLNIRDFFIIFFVVIGEGGIF